MNIAISQKKIMRKYEIHRFDKKNDKKLNETKSCKLICDLLKNYIKGQKLRRTGFPAYSKYVCAQRKKFLALLTCVEVEGPAMKTLSPLWPKLCNQVPSLWLSRRRTFTLLKI